MCVDNTKSWSSGIDFNSLSVVPESLKKVQVLPPKIAQYRAVARSLDTHIKFVRDHSQKSRIEFDKMRRYSGTILADEKDEKRGYSSVCTCGVKRLNADADMSPVGLVRGAETGKIFFNGLMKCGSVWRCPVCSYKITQHRQDEIYYMASEWLRKGFRLSFVTLTMRHKKRHLLKDSLELLLSEFQKLQRTNCYEKMQKEHGIFGFVKTCEITFGLENGWHPHLHLLVFHKSEDVENLHTDFVKNWCKRKNVKALQKNQRAKLVYDGLGISEYVTKWDMTKEMTQSNFKEGKVGQRFTPFSMLRKLAFNDFAKTSSEQILKDILQYKYWEYCGATKGKHFISVSKNLKKFFKEQSGEDLKTDEEILQNEKVDEVLVKIDVNLWDTFVKDKRVLPSYLINAYENGGIACVLEFFQTVGYRVKLRGNLIYSDAELHDYEIKPFAVVYVKDGNEWKMRRFRQLLENGGVLVYRHQDAKKDNGFYSYYEEFSFENPLK